MSDSIERYLNNRVGYKPKPRGLYSVMKKDSGIEVKFKDNEEWTLSLQLDSSYRIKYETNSFRIH
jgi:hypothetical protein